MPSRPITILTIGLLALAGAAEILAKEPAAKPVPAAGVAESDYPLVPVSKVLLVLSREGRETWEKDQKWPNERSDFAQQKKWRVEQKELLGALARKINPEPAVDAYIKFQLLSFKPDFAQADTETIRRIIATLPPVESSPMPQVPEPPKKMPPGLAMGVQQQTVQQRTFRGGRTTAQNPQLSVVQSGSMMYVKGTVSPDGRYVTASINAASANLVQLRRIQQTANRPVTVFRDALSESLPMDNGVRLAAMMKDTWDRIEAGDKSYEKSADRLVKAAQSLTPESPVNAVSRANLAAEAAKFAELKVQVIESVYPGMGEHEGRMMAKGFVAQFPPEKLKALLAALRGEPVPSPANGKSQSSG